MNTLPSTSTRMLRASVPTEVQEPEKSVSIGTHSTDSDEGDPTLAEAVDVPGCITLALSRSGLTSAQACAYMGLDPSHWSKQLYGRDNHQVSFQRLLRLPRRFWVEFVALLGQPLGVVVAAEDSDDAAMRCISEALSAFTMLAMRRRALRRAM